MIQIGIKPFITAGHMLTARVIMIKVGHAVEKLTAVRLSLEL